MSDRIADLKVEKLALDELPRAEAAAVAKALDAADDDRLGALRRDDAETLRRLPPAQVAAEVQRRLASDAQGATVHTATVHTATVHTLEGRGRKASLDDGGGRRGGWLMPSLALAAAGVLLWVVVRPGDGDSPTPGMDVADSRGAGEGPTVRASAGASAGADDEAADGGADPVRLKGETRLIVERLATGAPQLLRDGARASSGDRLQLSYIADGAPFGVIVSIDGSGGTTLHYPDTPSAVPTLADGRVSLSHSFELDDAPGYERFFLVTAPRDAGLVEAVMEAARVLAADPEARVGTLPLPDALDAQQRALRLDK